MPLAEHEWLPTLRSGSLTSTFFLFLHSCKECLVFFFLTFLKLNELMILWDGNDFDGLKYTTGNVHYGIDAYFLKVLVAGTKRVALWFHITNIYDSFPPLSASNTVVMPPQNSQVTQRWAITGIARRQGCGRLNIISLSKHMLFQPSMDSASFSHRQNPVIIILLVITCKSKSHSSPSDRARISKILDLPVHFGAMQNIYRSNIPPYYVQLLMIAYVPFVTCRSYGASRWSFHLSFRRARYLELRTRI